jgi:hypothetical protein
LRAALGRRVPEFDGRYYRFADLVVDPCAVQDRMPIWVGGVSDAALRRATRLGDGWIPAAVPAATLRERLREHRPAATDFDVVVGTAEELDPIASPQRAEEVLGELGAAGATIVQPRLRHTSLSQYLEQLDALSGLEVFRAA